MLNDIKSFSRYRSHFNMNGVGRSSEAARLSWLTERDRKLPATRRCSQV